MTFEQLMERQRFISKKYNAALAGKSSPATLNQLLLHMEEIRQAMWELGYRQQFELAAKKEDPFGDSIVN